MSIYLSINNTRLYTRSIEFDESLFLLVFSLVLICLLNSNFRHVHHVHYIYSIVEPFGIISISSNTNWVEVNTIHTHHSRFRSVCHSNKFITVWIQMDGFIVRQMLLNFKKCGTWITVQANTNEWTVVAVLYYYVNKQIMCVARGDIHSQNFCPCILLAENYFDLRTNLTQWIPSVLPLFLWSNHRTRKVLHKNIKWNN